jgi:AraC-like DNA-binding protein
MAKTAQPWLLKVANAHSLDIRHERGGRFTNPWHYHPELELNLILAGEGTRFVGDSVAPFGPGELVLLGSNLPHLWQSRPPTQGPARAEAVILRFRPDVGGASFWQLPEAAGLAALGQRAEKGRLFGPATAQQAEPLLLDLVGARGGECLWRWLQLLHLLAQAPDGQPLSSTGFANLGPGPGGGRIGRVLDYLQAHLDQPIDLATIADLAHMNASAFCRYFKQQTNKTLVETLNDLRVQYACRLLLATPRDVGDIALACGFGHVPYFNQVFKARTGKSPGAFRRELGKGVSG